MKKYIQGCRSKRHFDTEFEATIGAAKSEGKYRQEMIPYACGPHWHVTHKEPSMRGKHKKLYRCPHCKNIINEKKNPDHYGKCTMKP